MKPEKVKEMTEAGGKNRVRTLIKNSQMKKLINSLPPTIISSFTGARGINILYLNPPGINLTLPAIVAVMGCGVSTGRRGIKSEVNATVFRGMVTCQDTRSRTGRES